MCRDFATIVIKNTLFLSQSTTLALLFHRYNILSTFYCAKLCYVLGYNNECKSFKEKFYTF